jgi:hypothetical protein
MMASQSVYKLYSYLEQMDSGRILLMNDLADICLGKFDFISIRSIIITAIQKNQI